MVKPLKTRLNIVQRRIAARNPGKGNRAESKPLPDKGLNKGYYLGACNRSACLAPGADWYNHGSLAYYCGNCAHDLSNDAFNKRETLFDWGHDLCTPGKYDREATYEQHAQHRIRLGNMLARQPGLQLREIPTGTFELLLRQEVAADEIKAAKEETVLDYDTWHTLMCEKVPAITRHNSERAQEVRKLIYQEYVRHETTTT